MLARACRADLARCALARPAAAPRERRLFGYTRLDARRRRSRRLGEQVQPDRIKLLTPQQVAALGRQGRGARRRLRRMGAVLRRRSRAGAGGPRAAAARQAADAAHGRTPIPRTGSTPVRSRRAARPSGAPRSCGAQAIDDAVGRRPGHAASSPCRSACFKPRTPPTRGSRRSPTPASRNAQVEPRQQASRRRCSSSAIRRHGRCAAQGAAVAVPGSDAQGRRVHAPSLIRRRDACAGRGRASRARCSTNTRAWLDVDLCFQDFDRELATLPGAYAPPRGRLLLAGEPGNAFRLHRAAAAPTVARARDAIGEVKRLYVQPPRAAPVPDARLAEAVIADARAIGYRELKLDTLRHGRGARAVRVARLSRMRGVLRQSAAGRRLHVAAIARPAALGVGGVDRAGGAPASRLLPRQAFVAPARLACRGDARRRAGLRIPRARCRPR